METALRFVNTFKNQTMSEQIQEIKERLTLAMLLQHYGLKADKQNRLNCPFHPDKTPSLQLYYKTQTAYCFSINCKTHGKAMDVIDFIMQCYSPSKPKTLCPNIGNYLEINML